jgi:hypothetical protein
MNRITNLSKRGRELSVIGLLSCALFCQQAQAATVQGTIDIGGSVRFNTKSLAHAKKVNAWRNPLVMDDSGDFATFASPGDSATMALPWKFKGATPPSSLWRVGGFQLDLTSSSIVSQRRRFLSITGFGMISGNGFDPTPGSWTFTSSKAKGSTNTSFSFQAADPIAVPEPSILIMMLGGFGSLLGIQRFRRRL